MSAKKLKSVLHLGASFAGDRYGGAAIIMAFVTPIIIGGLGIGKRRMPLGTASASHGAAGLLDRLQFGVVLYAHDGSIASLNRHAADLLARSRSLTLRGEALHCHDAVQRGSDPGVLVRRTGEPLARPSGRRTEIDEDGKAPIGGRALRIVDPEGG